MTTWNHKGTGAGRPVTGKRDNRAKVQPENVRLTH
jgi:hypothetical protein